MTLTINLSITPGAACSVSPAPQPSSLPATPGAACSASRCPQPSSNPTTHDAPSFVIRHPFWPDLREKYLHTTDAELAQLIAKEPDRLYEYTAACFCLTD